MFYKDTKMQKTHLIILLLFSIILILFFLNINNEKVLDDNNINENQLNINNEKVLEDNNINENQAQKNEIRAVASSLIPEKTFLRDLAIIPETDKYLGIYIENYDYIEEICCWYGNESISGDYFLFLLENNEIIDVIELPKYGIYPDVDIDIFKISFLNKNNEVIDLIDFNDYTGDNLKHQFIVPGYYLPGGSRGKLIVGYNINENKLEVYPINLKKNKAWWLSDYEFSGENELKLLIQDCHYNMHCEMKSLKDDCVKVEDIRIFDHYRFNEDNRSFDYYKTTENKCKVF